MLSEKALAIHRDLTDAFIAQNSVELTLIPRGETVTATGGRLKTASTPRVPQVFSLIEPSDSGFRLPSVIAEGSQQSFDFMLLGSYDAIVEENDVFTYDGHEYKVMTLMIDNGYETRAMVLRHGW